MKLNRSVLLLTTVAAVFPTCLMQESAPLNPPYTCTTTTTLCQAGASSDPPAVPSTTQIQRGKSGPRGEKGSKGEQGEASQSDEEVARLRNEMETMKESYRELKQNFAQLTDVVTKFPKNCEEYKLYRTLRGNALVTSETVTIYPLAAFGDVTPAYAQCEPESEDTWIIIQRRIDGSTDFYRGWESYAEGFGIASKEFWIGLRKLHKLTTKLDYKLRIDLRNWANETAYAEYSLFRVSNEAFNFRLSVGGYSGTAGDGLAEQNGRSYSTYDRDNDSWGKNCAAEYQGAWWYKQCFKSNLNAQYKPSSDGSDSKGVSWTPWMGQRYSLHFSEMKMKLL